MRQIILQRLESSDEGTFGKIEVEGQIFYTAELPWRGNEKGKSCVPIGTHHVQWQESPRFGWCYELQDVPGRSDILIHKGNWAGDTALGYVSNVEGCILFGKSRGILRTKDGREQKAVVASGPAVSEFARIMRQEIFELEIKRS